MSAVPATLAILAGYLLGSLPFAWWLARIRGVDLRSAGTGNPGAANLFRQVSPLLGTLAAALDAAKGALAVLTGQALGLSDAASVLGGAAAIAGHWRPLLPRLPGGIGLATAIGATVALSPLACGAGLAAGLALTALRRNVGHGAGVGWVVFPGASLVTSEAPLVITGVMVLGLAVLLRARLAQGRQGRVE
ncbi:MAG: glycerol-3-phosphate acyltransferase [Dehalococcoidia bacterium]|nr:glycerol-3-phosphate acyltransferase [Dehalococcoidia bacterium]